MNVFEAIKKRSTVRRFLDKPIEKDVLDAVLDAARLAPSASNRQEWRFIVVENPKLRKRLGIAANGQVFVGEAPVVIVACAVIRGYALTCGQQSHLVDVAIALDHVSLAAVECGLGTCWIGAFNAEKVKEVLGIPEGIRLVALMPIGYPAPEPAKEKSRLPFDTIVKHDHW